LRRLLLILVFLAVAGLGAFWLVTGPQRVAAAGDKALEAPGDVELGRIVFHAGGCASCHATPNQPDRLRLGGGLELKSPFGSFYAPNISMHPRDGIGRWTTADLANAMLRGVAPDGSHYYPAFPYTSYAGMKLDDVRHLMAFLRTLAPVEGRARDHDLPFPFNIRRTLGVWKAMFLDTAPVRDDPARDASWNRGRYLTEALAHCSECHSPRNALGGLVAGRRYAGGPDPVGKGWNPNISQHPKALGEWSVLDIAGFLKTGFNLEGDAIGGEMGSVIKNMAELRDEDRLAIAEYLKSLPALEPTPRPSQK